MSIEDESIVEKMARHLKHANLNNPGSPERVLHLTGQFTDEQIKSWVSAAIELQRKQRHAFKLRLVGDTLGPRE
jgi:hypothetical protein